MQYTTRCNPHQPDQKYQKSALRKLESESVEHRPVECVQIVTKRPETSRKSHGWSVLEGHLSPERAARLKVASVALRATGRWRTAPMTTSRLSRVHEAATVRRTAIGGPRREPRVEQRRQWGRSVVVDYDTGDISVRLFAATPLSLVTSFRTCLFQYSLRSFAIALPAL